MPLVGVFELKNPPATKIDKFGIQIKPLSLFSPNITRIFNVFEPNLRIAELITDNSR